MSGFESVCGAFSFTHSAPNKSIKMLKKTSAGDNTLSHKNVLIEPLIVCSEHKTQMWGLISMLLMFIITHCVYPF